MAGDWGGTARDRVVERFRLGGLMERLFQLMVAAERPSPGLALLRSVAVPAAGAYGLLAGVRNRLFDEGVLPSRRARCRVVSVGNLTVGGTGKTPMVMWLAEFLQREGWRVAVASRGYGGTCGRRLCVVSDGNRLVADVRLSGDEPQLLARRLPHVPVLCSAHRTRAVAAAVEKFGAHAVILDDGFQHRRLARDLDLVLLDARSPLGNGRLFPRGPLRETPSALRRAHALVLSRFDGSPPAEANREELAKRWPEKAIFTGAYRPVRLFEAATGREIALSSLAGVRAAAFAGIATPQAFFRTIEDLGARLVYSCALPDHHPLSPALLTDLGRAAAAREPELWLTTEKDWVRLPATPSPAMDLWVLGIVLDLGGDSSRCKDLVRRALRSQGE
ncbi:MAG TPA: tetraacyldisaccharide 4'-kinase [Syntrophobacteria bacterium]|nr:tetraacyldisaccharide 4'-kinase [Syntrophobacteria bacterium]